MTRGSSNLPSAHEDMDRPIVPNTGGELEAADIVGRDELVADLLTCLADKGSVRIEDPRRMGKTSVLRLLASHATDNRPIIYVTVQGYHTTDDIVMEIARKLHGQRSAPSRLANLLQGIFAKTTEVSAGPLTWSAALESATATVKLERTLAALSGRLGDGHLVIAVDELPWAISNVVRNPIENGGGQAEAGTFLQALQRFRVNYPDIRWVISGSIGFHHVLRMAGETNAVLSGLRSVSCGPLSSDSSAHLARRLMHGAGVSPSDESTVQIGEASGGIPFIAHHLVELLAGRSDSHAADAAMIAEVFDDFVFDMQRSGELTHLLQRLDTYMTDDQAAVAHVCLDACAVRDAAGTMIDFGELQGLDGLAAVRPDDLRTVLDWLINDHYLVEHRLASGGHVYRWRYDVLRKVWMARRRL